MKRIWCRLKELWMDDYEEYDNLIVLAALFDVLIDDILVTTHS